MIDFLESGKGLYIEGVDFGSENSASPLYSYFGCEYLGNGNSSFYGNVSSVTGQPGTIAEGLTYDYLFQEGPDHYVDQIESDEGTIVFRCQGDTGRVVNNSGPSSRYRSIHSTIIFGALQENANTRNELMARYIAYLTGQTGIKNEITEPLAISNILKNYPNPFQIETKIYWSVKTRSSVEIKIYDCSGSLVKNLFNGQSEPGNHSIGWNGKNNLGKEVKPGTYFINFNNGSVSTTKAIIKTSNSN